MSLSHVQLFVNPWTVACQAPRSKGFPRPEYWNGLPFPGSSRPRDWTRVSCTAGTFFTTEPPGKQNYLRSLLHSHTFTPSVCGTEVLTQQRKVTGPWDGEWRDLGLGGRGRASESWAPHLFPWDLGDVCQLLFLICKMGLSGTLPCMVVRVKMRWGNGNAQPGEVGRGAQQF